MDDADRAPWDEDPEAEPEAALLLRPVWDEACDDPPGPPHPAWDRRPDGPPARPRRAPETAENLLAPLAAAQDALARLDARAETAPDPVRRGLLARLALREAAGWLAAQHAWVHPDDLALRVENLAGRFDTAAQIARPEHALPRTVAAAPGPWDDPEDLAALARNERLVVHALALARRLAALPRRHDPLAGVDAAAAWLGPLGVGGLDPHRFAAWRAAVRPAGRSRTGRDAVPAPALPPLLAAADAALAWMELGITDQPDALVALAIAALVLARGETLRTIPLPFWSAWPALGQPSDESLPRLRPAVARAICGMDRAPWPISFLAFAGEAARAGLRELDRLRAAAAAGRALGEGLDKRSRLPAAVDLVLASPVVTSRGLGEKLGITLQAANRILGVMVAGGVVREVTGRGRFRAFGV